MSSTPARYSIEPAEGLHRIKDVFRKRYMAAQCLDLLARLDEALDATLRKAPLRDGRQRYLMDHSGARAAQRPEGKLERLMHDQWRLPRCDAAPGLWRGVAAFQVNLPHKHGTGWGEIDLLGISDDGVPVAIELKGAGANDPPAKLVVQTAAYVIALQKAWAHLRKEWSAEAQKWSNTPVVLPTALYPGRGIAAAPTKYWDAWVGASAKARTVPKGSWQALRALIDGLRVRGVQIQLATVNDAIDPVTVCEFQLPSEE